jgi:quercetin dioxygenase-like cupin family protein
MVGRVRLMPVEHSIYELDDVMLLVFKPAGHREPTHSHAHAQRLRVLRGRLRVEVGSATMFLEPQDEPLSLAAGQEHATTALEATWVIAEAKS